MLLREQIAKKLLEIKAVSLVGTDDLFTWASGIKSPIYCDNRLTMSYPEVRKLIAQGFADRIIEEFGDVDIIAGTATAGIPHAAWVADILNKPMVYVRSTAKEHGKGNQIEGKLAKGQSVFLVEDLFSTGGSSLKAVDALVEAGANVLACGSIFTYNFPEVEKKFTDAGIKQFSLTDYKTLLPIAKEEGYIKAEDFEALKEWSENPRVFTK
jgi:orotate phosphoribosyltransferase